MINSNYVLETARVQDYMNVLESPKVNVLQNILVIFHNYIDVLTERQRGNKHNTNITALCHCGCRV